MTQINFVNAPTVEFDASPWGFGAVLRQGDFVVSYFYGNWSADEERDLGVVIGDPAHQTTFEFLALFMVLLVFGTEFSDVGLAIVGDNTASLSLALSLKGGKALGRVSREIAWRRIRCGWRYKCGHLPSELNVTADALSRMSEPAGIGQLPDQLGRAVRRGTPTLADVWVPDL